MKNKRKDPLFENCYIQSRFPIRHRDRVVRAMKFLASQSLGAMGGNSNTTGQTDMVRIILDRGHEGRERNVFPEPLLAILSHD